MLADIKANQAKTDARHNSRRSNSQDWRPSGKYRSRYECLVGREYDLPTKEGGLSGDGEHRGAPWGLWVTPKETVWATDDRSKCRLLAIRRHWQLKKRTQGDGGSRQKMATPQGWLTTVPLLHHARDVVIWNQAWTMYEESLKDESMRRDDGRNWNSTTA
jgi:hypothetical protein